MHENIREGDDVFLHDGDKGFGAVRQVRKHWLVVYIENAGDYEIPLEAVKDAETKVRTFLMEHLERPDSAKPTTR